MALNIKGITQADHATSQFILNTAKFTAQLGLWNTVTIENSKVDDFDKEEDLGQEAEDQLEFHKKVEAHLEEERERRRRKILAQQKQTKKEKKKEVQLLLNVL